MSDFLKENPDLSPSKMLQSKIKEVHESKKIIFKQIRDVQRKLNFFTTLANERLDEIEKLKNELAKKNKE